MTRVIDLLEDATPTGDDVLYVVDDPTGTPADRKVQLRNVRAVDCAEIYVTGGLASQALAAATWTKLTQFNVNGPSRVAVPDHANDRITVGEAGLYAVAAQLSFLGEPLTTYDAVVYWNGLAQNAAHGRAEIVSGVGTSVVSLAIPLGIVDVTTPSTTFELYVKADRAASIAVQEAQLTVFRLT